MGIRVSQCSYDKPSILIPRKGSLANVFYLDEPFWNVDTIFYTEIDESQVLPRYLYHAVLNAHVERYNKSSARPSLTQEILNNIKIPIPPLPVQELIVDLLDKLDDYAGRIDAVLPKEIHATRQRYEWWRDRLLDFKDIG